MRISSQVQAQVKDATVTVQPKAQVDVEAPKTADLTENSLKQMMRAEQQANENEAFPREKVQKAIDSLNEFMTMQNHSSKFVMHDGLDRYFVQVIDAETEEVIREIPPRKLLDAFYTMQKFLGMIVDEKI
ncbi:flagellar protein FlaG [Viridibacillus sp. FSL H7-0596]|uniref:flagellar protein FlaG n=1 Tax=Viridibacillus sp. FSL H7-0596 TaxID=1928923 RepID=UPI0009F9DA43|nr:flagellar protein FlaG [Viridibacillus sp. FSL H7-0596]